MNRYRKNVFRTAWRNRGSVFGAMLIIAIGIFVFVSMIDTLRNLQDRILDYYKEAQLAEAFASVQGIGTDELSALSDLDGIRAAEGKLSGDIRMLADGQEEIVTLHLVSYDERDTINRLRLSGRFRKDTDIFIGKRMSDIYGFREGQEIRLLMDGSPCTFTYAGVCDGPDYIYSVPPSGAMVPDGEVYDLACVTLPAMEQLTGKAGKRTELGFLLEPGTDFEDVRAGLRERLSKSGLRSLCARKDQVSWNMVDGEMTELVSAGTVIPALFMIISVFMTYVVNKKQIERERTLIGTMKAFGMRDGELIGSYLAVGALGGTLGALLGILPAGALGRYMFGMYVDFFNLADPVMCNQLCHAHVQHTDQPFCTVIHFFASLLCQSCAAHQLICQLQGIAALSPNAQDHGQKLGIGQKFRTVPHAFLIGLGILRQLFHSKIHVSSCLSPMTKRQAEYPVNIYFSTEPW